MWYKNGGLICVIVVSPEKKMSQQPYPMTADSLLCFSGSFDQPLFSPLYPLVCAILPWTSLQVNFLFLAFFLLVPYFRYSFQRSKNNLLGGLAAPSFSHFQNFATQNASIAHIKGYFWVAKLQNNYTRQSTFLNSDPVVFFYPVSVGPLPSSSCPCDAPWPPVLPIWKRDRKNVP